MFIGCAQTLLLSSLNDARQNGDSDVDSIAVVHHGRDVAYRDLHAHADRLADALIEAGVVPGVLVGLCLHRSPERLAAMLAIWKTGGAVLALDPAWPLQRLSDMMVSAGAVLALVGAGQDLGRGLRQLTVDADCVLAASDHQNQACRTFHGPHPHGLAYVVYTSGSTGQPKGVEIQHCSLDNLVRWHIGQFGLGPHDRVSNVAGLGFDAVFWEVLPALCAGATVVLPDDLTRTSPTMLQRWLLEERITCAFVPTVLAELLFGLDWPPSTPLRVMLVGGEVLHLRPPSTLPFKVFNNYGPSECTVVTTSGLVAPDDPGLPSIGTPIPGMQVYLLDQLQNPVMDGEAGEIVIGGIGVGQGYHNMPEPTRNSFIADRFGQDSGALLYRSGDIGRRLTDGSIAFCGRLDKQEQIRGVRVEPAEVALALSQHADVEWCTVIGQGLSRERSLRAYLLLRHAATTDAESLRRFLQATLPEPMIPQEFLQIDAVPLTSSGKLDTERLIDAAGARPLGRAGFRAPATPVEICLATIIGDLLGGVAVGLDDNFFFLGGHSLLGTQVVIRIRESFGTQLSLRDIFTSPTVAELANIVTLALMARLASMTEEEAELQVLSGC